MSGSLYADRNCGDTHMLFTFGVVTVLIAVGLVHKMRMPGGIHSDELGSMSEKWLAEHRASHSG